jgi:hypothetical protein
MMATTRRIDITAHGETGGMIAPGGQTLLQTIGLGVPNPIGDRPQTRHL